jgi:hypothetical protein
MTRIILVFLAFAAVHSITVSRWFKDRCGSIFGDAFLRVWYRFLYTVVSIVTGAVAVLFILQVPDRVLWEAPTALRWVLHGIQLAGLYFGSRAFQHLDKWEFLGFRQVWRYLTKKGIVGNVEGLTEKELVTSGVYGIVRHPLYVAGIIVVTFSPRFTVNSIVITVLADLYFLFGMLIEERRFLRVFGNRYREYMQKVPRMFPHFKPPQPPL